MFRRFRAVSALVLVSVASSGCSLLFMDKPPVADGPLALGDCTRSVVAPGVDGGFALYNLSQAAHPDLRAWGDSNETTYRVGAALAAAVAGYSAIRGVGWSNTCKQGTTLSEQAITDHLRAVGDRMAKERAEGGDLEPRTP